MGPLRRRCLVLLAVSAATAVLCAQPGGLSAEAVARRVRDRDTGRDSRQTLRMKLADRHGRVRERVLEVTTLRGRNTPGASLKPGASPSHSEPRRGATLSDGDRLLIRFTYPHDIRGTSFLVWARPAAEDERFLYLPSLGRVRRIAGSETQDSFVGSDFTYEDIGGREFDDYTYAFSGGDGQNAAWTPPDGGAARPAWRLESRQRDASTQFPRVVSLVLKDNFVMVQADVYNRRHERQKVYIVRKLATVEGIWTVMDSEMTNALAKTRTELSVEQVDYNVGLRESDFSRRELERGVGRSGRN